MTPSNETMSSVDLAWLRMDRPTNPMTIMAVLVLASHVTTESVRSCIESRLLRFPRFKQFPLSDTMSGQWIADPHFDLHRHVRTLTLPPRAVLTDLHAAASDLASVQLDPRRPMWEMHVIERYGKGSAVIARFHHCYADGIAMIRVLLSLTDSQSAPPTDASHESRRIAGSSPAAEFASSLIPLVDQVVGFATHLVGEMGGLATTSINAIGHPMSTLQKAVGTGVEITRLAMLNDDPNTALKEPLSGRKEVTWGEPLKFFDVRTIAKAHECSINDVLLSTAAGALGAWLRESDRPTDGLIVRGLVPVNLRPPDDPVELGNRFGLVFATLFVGMRNPIERLYATHDAMEKLKSSVEPIVTYGLLSTVGSLFSSLENEAVEVLTRKASLVISNVPGPHEALYLCGARIKEIYFWVPQAGSIGLGLSLLSYGPHVHFGVMADHDLIAAPHRLTELFAQEFERLVLSTLLFTSKHRPRAT